ncbi:hypothetical protein [Polyangium sp. 6x1]|uniref:hypothetical protein n=1 Tax=Polyangium sp. 6x1 TaxID=3042689 RepID=UPI0024823C2B|nr:hypothetical protein [Polyangium sp. 6x1]MDI1442607.1 hypothetical protein [Polyangium sp. 6x1]
MIESPRSIHVVGKLSSHCVTVVMPRDEVAWMLPDGLTLGPQDHTPPGTHPVLLSFNHRYGAHLTLPRMLLPGATYKEQIVGVPFVHSKRDLCGGRARGPFLFLPRLFASQLLPVIGGWLFWGFAKHHGSIRETTVDPETTAGGAENEEARSEGKPRQVGTFRVFSSGSGGEPLVSLRYEVTGEFQPATQAPNHEAILDVLRQPLICCQPISRGPLFSCADHESDWERAQVRPLDTTMRIEDAFVPGLVVGTYRSRGIDRSPLGSFELRAPFKLTLPHCCGRGHRLA